MACMMGVKEHGVKLEQACFTEKPPTFRFINESLDLVKFVGRGNSLTAVNYSWF